METLSQTEPRSESIQNSNFKEAYEQKLSDLETQRLEALDRAIILQKQVDNLQSILSSKDQEQGQRRVDLDELTSRVGYLENSTQAKDEIIKDLVNEKEKLAEELEAKKGGDSIALDAKLRELRDINTKLLQDTEGLRDQNAKSFEEGLESKGEIGKLSDKVRTLAGEKQELLGRIANLEQSIEVSNSNAASLQAQNEAYTDKVTEISKKYDSVCEALSASDSKVKALLVQLNQEQSDFSAEKVLLETRLADSAVQILNQASLKVEKQNLETKIFALQDSLTASEERYKTMSMELEQRQLDYARERKDYESRLVDANNSKISEIELLTSQKQFFESQIATLQESLTTIQNQTNTLLTQLDQSQANFTFEKNLLESRLANAEAEYLKQTSENQNLINTLQESVAASDIRYKTLREEVLQSRDNHDKIKEEYETLKTKYATSGNQNDSAVQSLKDEIAKLQNENKEISSVLTRMKIAVELAQDEGKKNLEDGKVFEREILVLKDANTALEQKNEELNEKLAVLAKRFLDGNNEKHMAFDKITDLERKLDKVRQVKKEQGEKIQALEAEAAKPPVKKELSKEEAAKMKSLEKQLGESRELVIQKKFEVKGKDA